MDKYVEELFVLINETIEKFLKNNPECSYSSTSMNAVIIFTSTLVNALAKGESLKEKLKLLDELVRREKKWIEYEHQRTN
jgi:hypothetical protein